MDMKKRPKNLKSEKSIRKPPWLKRNLPTGSTYESLRALLKKGRLHTVCQEAKCPNIWECFSRHTATFLIMGSQCTRNCRFCAVEHGPIDTPDPEEPVRVAKAAQSMKLHYIVITSVTRDDLPDGGAALFAETIKEIHNKIPDVFVEVLIPDFQGNADALHTVVKARPDVLNHNLETVARLYPQVRPEAVYHRSLELLKRVQFYDKQLLVEPEDKGARLFQDYDLEHRDGLLRPYEGHPRSLENQVLVPPRKRRVFFYGFL